MPNFTVPIPLSLYIHLPWCARKCPYCDFNSHEFHGNLPEELYINALTRDLDDNLPAIWGRGLMSIFFGGGTPSLFSPSAIEKILTIIHSRLRFGASTEITLEANPGTIDESRFKGFRAAGVNRLSIGIQSLQDSKLKALGRIHDREYALRAIESAINAGFTNFNLDLMHGLPDQSVEEALGDLHDALQFQPPHLSWYQLTIEPNTFFHNQTPTLPDENILWDIQEAGKTLLAKHHLNQYEVSAYALEDRQCLHNLNYWEFGDYLGIGAGAHSKLTQVDEGTITRHWQVKNPKDYLDKSKNQTANRSILSPQDCVFEFMLNALRLTGGVPSSLFEERTGLALQLIEPMLSVAREKKLLMKNSEIICATPLGQRYLNDLLQIFLN